MISRRTFHKMAVAARPLSMARAAKLNSVVDGVHLGVQTYSYRELPLDSHVDAVIRAMTQNGLSECELFAQQVARETVKGPQEEIFRQASRQNFIWAANQRDANGQPLVDPTTLAQTWANLPAELTAKAERDCFVGASLTVKPRYEWKL